MHVFVCRLNDLAKVVTPVFKIKPLSYFSGHCRRKKGPLYLSKQCRSYATMGSFDIMSSTTVIYKQNKFGSTKRSMLY